jgi:hypothetical protein
MGLLLSSTATTKTELANTKTLLHRIVDCHLEGYILIANSDANSGTLTTVKIWDPQKHLVLQEAVSGYEDEVDLSGLSSGNYSAQIFTTQTVYSENFTLN